MPEVRPRSSLGFIVDKLRASLALKGDVGLDLEPGLRPVVITNDVTRAGCNSGSGRRFCFAQNVGAVAGNSMVGLLAAVPIIVTRLWVDWTAAAIGTGTLQHSAPDVAVPFAMGVFGVPWAERRAVSTDVSPVSTATAVPTAGPVARTVVMTVGVPLVNRGWYELLHEPMHLEAGASLYLTNGLNTTSWLWGFEGQIF